MKSILSLALALVALLSVSTASAQKEPKPGVHENEPSTFRKDTRDQSLIVCYDIGGLGNVSTVNATVRYNSRVDTYCLTKGGGHGDETNPIPAFSDTDEDVNVPITLQVRNGRAVGCTDLNNTITCAQDLCSPGLRTTCTATYSNVRIIVLGHTFTASAQ